MSPIGDGHRRRTARPRRPTGGARRAACIPGEGGERGRGRGSSPAVPDAWQRWLDAWAAGDATAGAGDEWNDVVAEQAPVHWIHNEQRATIRSPQAPEVADRDADQADDDAAKRRAGAEVRGWPAIAGHQRRNRGWQGRHHGSREVGRGLQVKESTKEERRLGHRIAHSGEHLIFRAPNCECDPHARPLVVGADLCTHRLCHHCAMLRSRKLAARVREMIEQLRSRGITRYALLTLTYRSSTSARCTPTRGGAWPALSARSSSTAPS